ncbi:ComEA family DNA-binding protein [Tunicatimonas pelagia]|uniref:ComEA family DNA-binding protein n=1 Tax=Tunicatimonas pelagia TaxID=931531 RepID=UPI002665B701|nr:helix-hairpin-helix domain-containing protein [Tunicatimonas pelagia]WKN43155.1 helix-hairpin-helix domain-containing protein [Tunicatimonas pelagia]
MKQLNRIIRDYFGFSATELRGFWILSVLAVVLLAIPPITKEVFLQSSTFSHTNPAKLDSIIALLEQPALDQIPITETPVASVDYVRFNPNNAPREVLVQNSIPSWLADRIIKYRNKGGRFRKKADLLKIYGFPEDLYAQLEHYVVVPEKVVNNSERKVAATVAAYPESKEYRKFDKKELVAFDINQADSIRLKQIPGIGTVLSSRIIRFRDKLGGLHSKQQLKEVYQISDEAAQNLQKYTYISPDYEVAQLSLNTDNASGLAQHPYVSYKLARAIVDHRKNYGDFLRIEDCREVYLMEDSVFQKIAPYLGL